MTLLDIRKQFVTQSGRYDLVVDTSAFADAGADYYIQEGQRFLDRRATHKKSNRTTYPTLAQDAHFVVLATARALGDVYVFHENAYIELEKLSQREFFRCAATDAAVDIVADPDIIKTITPSTPRYYTIVDMQDFPGLTDEKTGKCILLNCPSDVETVLKVSYLSYTTPLSADTDTNFWTLEAPQTIIQAALYTLERAYRNREGMVDHLQSIDLDLQGLDYDVVEEEQHNVTQMKDSW